MRWEIFQKYVRNNHKSCDNHSTTTDLINGIEVLSTEHLESLKDELFDEIRFEIYSKELAIDEDKAVFRKMN